MVEGEEGDAGGNEGDDAIFIERVGFAEDGELEEHDGEELARFGEEEGDVVDVGEGGVAERGGEGGGDGDEEEGREKGEGGDGRWGRLGAGRAGEEVDVAG